MFGDKVIDTITTMAEHVWYDITVSIYDAQRWYNAFRYDAEQDSLVLVARDTSEEFVRGEVRRHMARTWLV